MNLVFCCFFGAFSAIRMFHVSIDRPTLIPEVRIALTLSKDQCNNMVLMSIPIAITSCFIFLLVHVGISAKKNGRNDTQTRKRHIISAITRGFVSALCIGVLSVPFMFLSPELQNYGFLGSSFFVPLWFKIQPYHISNSYGLFRRMTGVGKQMIPPLTNRTNWGWGGLPPSVVARPEIIIEGLFVSNSIEPFDYKEEQWREIKFRWKPGGDLTIQPRQVAPHQPRLDWQMWFAALGNYQSNPWLIHFMSKLLDGCSPVAQLVDEPELASGAIKLSKVRAIIWDYDFTRLPTKWNERIPDVTFSSSENDFWTGIFRRPSEYWTRSNPRVYVPPLQVGQADDYLVHHGFIRRTSQNPIGKQCYKRNDRCFRYNKRSIFCEVIEKAREFKAEVGIPIFTVIFMNAFLFITARMNRHIQSHVSNGLAVKKIN